MLTSSPLARRTDLGDVRLVEKGMWQSTAITARVNVCFLRRPWTPEDTQHVFRLGSLEGKPFVQ